jgi:UDP-glucose 6-dehydrogenase
MEVPGHDGKKGFGGACFTKDTAALLKYSEEVGENFSLLGSVININNSIRREYHKLGSREKDQNVNYEIDS